MCCSSKQEKAFQMKEHQMPLSKADRSSLDRKSMFILSTFYPRTVINQCNTVFHFVTKHLRGPQNMSGKILPLPYRPNIIDQTTCPAASVVIFSSTQNMLIQQAAPPPSLQSNSASTQNMMIQQAAPPLSLQSDLSSSQIVARIIDSITPRKTKLHRDDSRSEYPFEILCHL